MWTKYASGNGFHSTEFCVVLVVNWTEAIRLRSCCMPLAPHSGVREDPAIFNARTRGRGVAKQTARQSGIGVLCSWLPCDLASLRLGIFALISSRHGHRKGSDRMQLSPVFIPLICFSGPNHRILDQPAADSRLRSVPTRSASAMVEVEPSWSTLICQTPLANSSEPAIKAI